MNLYFTLGVEVDVAVHNENWVPIAFTELTLRAYHSCCEEPVATVVEKDKTYEYSPRSNSTNVIRLDIDSESPALNQTNFFACAQQYYLTSKGCSLRVVGSVVPTYAGFKVPPQELQFNVVLKK